MMTATIDTSPKFLKEGTIDVSNMHLFAPDVQEAFLFFQEYEDKPINPIKHAEAVRVAFQSKFRSQIIEKKQNNATLVFKSLITDLLYQLPNDWEDDQVIDIIVWAKKVWQEN
jgi:hypothetical protein